MSAREYTIYFAWVPPNTAWDISLARFDENIFDLVLAHDEGQIPEVTIVVKNPRIGFINPSREYWAWFSFSYDSCGPFPLVLARLVGIPTEILKNTVQMKFTARPTDYVYQKQHIADSLKLAPCYDPLSLELTKRGDPDAILEGWSALYHVDRVIGRVSASDILLGEDGTIVFAPQDVFYDSVDFKLLQSPLKSVNVKIEVAWEQQYRSAFYVGQWAFPTLGGDPVIGDWPKSGSSVGSGWSVGVAWAGERDPSIQTQMMRDWSEQTPTYQYEWHNTEKHHETGDTMSVTLSYKPPFGNSTKLREKTIMGMIDANATDSDGNPDPINRPAHQEVEWFCYWPYALNFEGKQSVASLGLVYDADRKRSERLEMTITADVQPILIDPLVPEDTEQINLKTGDLSLPVVTMLNWSSVGMGGAVTLGQIIFPDNPLVPGQTSSQICIQAGNTGMVIPTFSNIAGQTTVDGTVIWASLGETPPAENSQDWIPFARVSLGTMIIPKPVSGVPDFYSVQVAGSLNYPPTGVPVPQYAIFCNGYGGPGDLMHECIQAGILGGLSAVQAVFTTFINPTGAFMYIAIQAGETGAYHTTFNETVGSHTADGTVVWQCIGPVVLPIGGWPGMTPASSFFPSDRGQLFLLHGVARARAKLKKRARAAQLNFETRFEAGAQLSCRMNASVSDERLPGGSVSGKVIGYTLEAHGDTGVFTSKVKLGCSIGKKTAPIIFTDLNAVPSYVGVPGTPNGYVKRGYQQYYSSEASGSTQPPQQGTQFPAIPTPPNWYTRPPTLPPLSCPPLDSYWVPGPVDPGGEDFGYTPPVSQVIDDGVTFPAGQGLILKNQWHGTPSTINPFNIELYNLEIQTAVETAIRDANRNQTIPVPAIGGIATSTTDIPAAPYIEINAAVQKAVIQSRSQGSNLWYELVLKPLHNGPFAGYYMVNTTELPLLKTVDLSAPSSGLMSFL